MGFLVPLKREFGMTGRLVRNSLNFAQSPGFKLLDTNYFTQSIAFPSPGNVSQTILRPPPRGNNRGLSY